MGTSLSRYDGILIDGAAAGKSGDELSKLVGGTLSAAECIVRVRRVLADRDVWSSPERRKLMLHRVYNLVDDLTQLAENSQDAKDFSNLIKSLNLLRQVLSEQGAISDEEMQRLVQMQARAMLDMVSKAFDFARERLSEMHPELDMEQVEDAFEEGLVLAQAEDA